MPSVVKLIMVPLDKFPLGKIISRFDKPVSFVVKISIGVFLSIDYVVRRVVGR